MSNTPEALRTQAARYRQRAADIRQGAQYADSAQARQHDEHAARDYESRAAELERQAAKLEAEQSDGYTVGEAHPAVGEPGLAACPFCGEASLDVIRPDGFPEGFPAMQVICRNPGCLCSGPVRPDRGEAISYWNARADLHPV